MSEVAAVVLAGGSGTRFSDDISKVYVPLGERPVLQYALETVELSSHVDHIVVVIRDVDETHWADVQAMVQPTKVRAAVVGGSTRHASEWAGLQAIVEHVPQTRWVMLHDAARPFLTLDLVARLVDTATGTGAGVVPAHSFTDDIVDQSGRLVDGSKLVSVQTPQLFSLADLTAAYSAAAADNFHGVDTAETVQVYRSTPIRHVASDRRNIKITTLDDLLVAESWVSEWDRGRWV
ncbi:IspD/TarI family cytidylyltransferase [Euzebya tangerina]|uniref:IspD/TarI family cytidylyltransferase n=1 Tax=Euzebya tangerina TaxID=591198 RepID=UPI000E313686|nr:IspD/TarI family cytidylyltransferase [Euzebya tangerina]